MADFGLTAYEWRLKAEMALETARVAREHRKRRRDADFAFAGSSMLLGVSGAQDEPQSFTSVKLGSSASVHRPTAGAGGTRRANQLSRGQTFDVKDWEKRRGGKPRTASISQSGPIAPMASATVLQARFTQRGGSNQGLASGARPAVIKVLSYAHGGARAGATAAYIKRKAEQLETQDGRLLASKEEIDAELALWAEAFDKCQPSKDVAYMRLTVDGLGDNDADRAKLTAAMAAAFKGHAFVSRIDVAETGLISGQAIVVLAGEEERFAYKRGDTVALTAKSMETIESRVAAAGIDTDNLKFHAGVPGHGREAAQYRMRKLLEQGSLTTDAGQAVASIQDVRDVASDWARVMQSRSPRDTMHVMVSAKADTDIVAFERAVSAFLHETFADHKFMFGLHNDRAEDSKGGHIHAHAIVAVRGENGDKLRPNKSDFLTWRETYASKAQEQGLNIVATTQAQTASQKSYGARDKQIVDVANTPREGYEAQDKAYHRQYPHVAARARHRMTVAKVNPVQWAVTDNQRKAIGESQASWSAIAASNPSNRVAAETVLRLNASLAGGAAIREIYEITKGDIAMVTSQQMSERLSSANGRLNKATESMEPEQANQLRERAGRILTDYASRIDVQRLAEAGIRQIPGAEVARIVAVGGSELIRAARRTEAAERREAADARNELNDALNQKDKGEANRLRAIDNELARLKPRVSSDETDQTFVRSQELQAERDQIVRGAGKPPASQTESERTAGQKMDATRRNVEQQGREAEIAARAAQDLATRPDATIQKTDSKPLKNLEAAQDAALDKMRAETSRAQKPRPQRQ